MYLYIFDKKKSYCYNIRVFYISSIIYIYIYISNKQLSREFIIVIYSSYPKIRTIKMPSWYNNTHVLLTARWKTWKASKMNRMSNHSSVNNTSILSRSSIHYAHLRHKNITHLYQSHNITNFKGQNEIYIAST